MILCDRQFRTRAQAIGQHRSLTLKRTVMKTLTLNYVTARCAQRILMEKRSETFRIGTQQKLTVLLNVVKQAVFVNADLLS